VADFVYADELEPGSIPSPINLEYADESARLSATGLNADNLRDFARQLDDNSVWMLLQITPVLKWKKIDPDSFYETTRDKDIYFGAGGNDETGNGELAAPYATFTQAYVEHAPRRLKHTIKFRPLVTTPGVQEVFTDFPIVIDHVYDLPGTYLEDDEHARSGGHLIIDASGLEYPIISSHTVDTVTTLSPNLPGSSYGLGVQLKVTDTPSWITDEMSKYWLRFTSGAFSGWLFPVEYNGSDYIQVLASYGAIAPTDTFDIVEQPIAFHVDHQINFAGNYSRREKSSGNEPQLGIAGVKFLVSDALLYQDDRYLFSNVSGCYNFCSFLTETETATTVVKTANSAFWVMLSVYFDDPLIHQFGGTKVAANSGDVGGTANYTAIRASNSTFYLISTRSIIKLFRYCSLNTANCGALHCFNVAGKLDSIKTVYIGQAGFSDDAITLDRSIVSIKSIYVNNASVGCVVGLNSRVDLTWLHGGTITDAQAIHMDVGSNLILTDGANVTITGTGTPGDIKWLYDNSTSDYPATPYPSSITDGVGSYVVTKG
jgi:hypothetical protein